MALEDSLREVMINSVMFSTGAIEISYFEARDQSTHAGLVKTLVMDRARFPQVEDVIEDLTDLVDAGLLEIRNPTPSLNPRERVGRGPVEEPDE